MSVRGERLGVFGGTFDPPHIGHLVTAVDVRHSLGLDRVALVVANLPWQKVDERTVTPASDRLAMVTAAVADVEGIEASSIEIDRGGPSYMVETLRELADADPAGCRFLILGADAAGGLETWERYMEIPALATLVLVDRPGMICPEPPTGWAFERVTVPRIDVSSTELRRRVRDGEPIDFLTAPGVVYEVTARGLYR